MSRMRFVLIVVAATLGSGCFAAQASAYVYWANYGAGTTIGRANLDGSGANQTFITGASGPVAVAVDGQRVYWANSAGTTVGRANLDGSSANQSFITGASGPGGVAVDGQHVYWANRAGTTIGRANLDGTGANQSFITGANTPGAVAVDSQRVYWANSGGTTIGRANLDGTGANQSFITVPGGPYGVAIDGQHVYWANYNSSTIGRANLDGSAADQSFITGASGPVAVAVDGQHLYWTNYDGNTIGRANLDGSGVDQSFIAGASTPYGVAVDSGPPGMATASASSLSFASQPLDTLSSSQMVVVTNTGHGVLALTGEQLTSGAIDDFLITADTCSGASLQIGAACAIDVRFAPSVTGQRSATLMVSSNNTSGPLQISLSGTGGQLPQGPPGPQGRSGNNGLVELVTCKTHTRTVLRRVHGKRKRIRVSRQVCTTRTITGPVTFTTSFAKRAVLSRAGVVYAQGTALRAGKLLLSSRHALGRGHYTLTLTWSDRHHHRHTIHQGITFG